MPFICLGKMHFWHLNHRQVGQPTHQRLPDDGNRDVDTLLLRLVKMPMTGVSLQRTPRDKRSGPLVLPLARHDRVPFVPNIEALPGGDDGMGNPVPFWTGSTNCEEE